MNNYKIEIKITGQLIGPGYFVYLEGHQITLLESSANVYTRTIDDCPVDEPLDVVVMLRGWYGTPWTIELNVNGMTKIKESGSCPKKGIINISRQINLP